MAGKLSFMVGLGAGYVLGARSGRERYEQIASKAQELWHDPRVQEKAGQAQHLVKDKMSSSSQSGSDSGGLASPSGEGASLGGGGAATGDPTSAVGGSGPGLPS